MLYRDRIPQLGGDRTFITDGGLETTLVFREGIDLPCFAAFDLLTDSAGRETIRAYFDPYLAIAHEHHTGFVLDCATWRANPDWGARLGYSPRDLDDVNRRAVALAEGIRLTGERALTPIAINGVVGPRGDGYSPATLMSADEAQRYHAAQVNTFAQTAADMVSAVTMTNAEEAVGIARAAVDASIPVAIAFTVETDGRLPAGQPLRDAVEQVDAETADAPIFYMVNCAHPTHFEHVLGDGGEWLGRIGGLRANASTKSHAEFDEAAELDDGDPADLAARYRALRSRLPNLTVVGGCCGTDHRHIAAICREWPV